jgi:cytochrome c-type biogenesis protein CcmH
MLARSLVVLGRYGEAVAAFEKAVSNLEDAALFADYADAVAMTQNGRLAGRPMQLVRRALKLDPANSKALALAGTDAFDRRNYRRAALFWEAALTNAPPDSEYFASLRASLNEARSLGGLPAASPDTASGTSHPAADQVSGRITVSPDLMRKIPAAGTLLIYARAENGPRMPAAILRKDIRELADEFVLDDRASMSPELRISDFKSVVVTVRISVSGDAMPASGDLIGSSGPVPVGTHHLRVEINETIR